MRTSPHLSFWWIQTRKIATVLYTLWLWFLSKLSKKTFHILLHLAVTTNSVRETLGMAMVHVPVQPTGYLPLVRLHSVNWDETEGKLLFFTFSWNIMLCIRISSIDYRIQPWFLKLNSSLLKNKVSLLEQHASIYECNQSNQLPTAPKSHAI